MEVVIQINNREKAKLLLELLQSLDFVESIATSGEETMLSPDNKVANEAEFDEGESDFFSLIGIWKDRDITIEKIREQAWPKR